MSDSILTSIKKLLGIDEAYTAFDTDIIFHINSVLVILSQIGLTEEPLIISDASTTWSDLLGDAKNLELVKSYMYMKVKMMFDPPTGSLVNEAMKENLAELEWRIHYIVNPISTT